MSEEVLSLCGGQESTLKPDQDCSAPSRKVPEKLRLEIKLKDNQREQKSTPTLQRVLSSSSSSSLSFSSVFTSGTSSRE